MRWEAQEEGALALDGLGDEVLRGGGVRDGEVGEVDGSLDDLEVAEERQPLVVLEVGAAAGVVGAARARGERKAEEVIRMDIESPKLPPAKASAYRSVTISNDTCVIHYQITRHVSF